MIVSLLVFLVDVALVMANGLEVGSEDQEELVYGDGEGVAPKRGRDEAELEMGRLGDIGPYTKLEVA